MKRNALTLGLLVITISACAPQSAPTLNPLDVQHTAEAAAFTMIALTQEAMPTPTPVPPTETDSPPPPPALTSTSPPTVEAALSTVTSTPAPATQQSAGSTADACNKILSSWQGPTANLSIMHDYKPQKKDDYVVVSLWVSTELGECGFLADLSRGPVGQYSASASVNGQQNFNVFGGFRITQGSWKIVIRNDKIVALGSCYPNC